MRHGHARRGAVSKGFLVVAAIAIVGTPAGFLGYKLNAAGKRSVAERQDAGRVLFSFPLHDENREYFDRLIDSAHPVAFKEGYRMGGLLAQAEFDEAVYNRALADELLRLMRAQNDERASELADALDEHFVKHPALFN